jgi:hypothetical protein
LEWALPIQKDCLGVEHDDGEGKLNIALPLLKRSLRIASGTGECHVEDGQERQG